jgi:hypothetical protein
MAKKNLYTAWVSNSSGANTDVHNGGSKFTSIREAADSARRQFGPGWTVHIVKVWVDGDGSSYNPEYNEEVKTFTIRQ